MRHGLGRHDRILQLQAASMAAQMPFCPVPTHAAAAATAAETGDNAGVAAQRSGDLCQGAHKT